MHDDKAKKIGSATYQNKTIGLFIPFLILTDGADCSLIQPMLDKANQVISYLNKDNKT